MPLFKFYFSDQDRLDLFNYIQLKGGMLIPDLQYSEERYVLISDHDTFSTYIEKQTTHFFLIDKSFYTQPLVISKNRFSTETIYSINQRKGGPYIDLSFYRGYGQDSIIPYKASEIDLYSTFIDSNSSDNFRATDELKTYFKEVVSYIKSKCSIISKNGNKHWVSNEVLKELP